MYNNKAIKEKIMTYLEFKNISKELNKKVDYLSSQLNSYDWENEKVRMSNEFQTIKKEYNKAFKLLQDFNKTSDKKTSKTIKKRN